jgi:predicted ATPase
VTFLFTDLEGSTRLWEERAAEMDVALKTHDELVRGLVSRHHGHIFSIAGDSFGASFVTASDALQVACDIQAGLADEPLLSVRIGIHTGESTIRNDNYFGTEVNRAARIMSAGHGGQTLLSDATVALLSEASGSDLTFTALGAHALRDLSGTTTFFQVGTHDHPPLRTAENQRGNLPTQRTSFIGRHAEVKDLTELLRPNRLVTICGAGGMGKSRLATHVAAEIEADFTGGAWMAALASLTDPSKLAFAIKDAIGLRDRVGDSALDTLTYWFTTNEVLLILDNCEHVLEEASEVIDQLLASDGTSRILTTSQQSLAVRGEHTYALEPMTNMGPGGDSVGLFTERARLVRDDFTLTDDNESIVYEICERLDNLPLAIELAASRMRGMGPAELVERLDARFHLLASRDRSVPNRHQTLENAVRWSYELLNETQQLVLRRLSVFAAPFSLGAAETVLTGDGIEEWLVLDTLMDLVDRSLVVAAEAQGSTRYHLLSSIKAFANAQLRETDEAAAVEAAYVSYYQNLVLDQRTVMLGPDDQQAFALIDADWGNIRLALEAAAGDRHSTRFDELYVALAPVWLARSRTVEGSEWAQQFLDRPVLDPQLRASVLGAAAALSQTRNTGDGAPLVAMAEELWVTHDLRPPLSALANRALVAMMDGQDDVANEYCAIVLDGLAKTDDLTWGRYNATSTCLSVLALVGDKDRFREAYVPALRFAEDQGSTWFYAAVRASAASLEHELDRENARTELAITLNAMESIGSHQATVPVAMMIAMHELRCGDVVAAAKAQVRALSLAHEYAPAYIGMQLNTATAVLLGPDMRSAAVCHGAVSAFQKRRHQPGSSRQQQAHAFFKTMLTDQLGEDYETLRTKGALFSDDEMVAFAHTALSNLLHDAPQTKM